MLKPKKIYESETFNDGILKILEAEDGVILSEKEYQIRYGIKTVGAVRFYKAQVAGTEIEKMISVPFNYFIKQMDLIEIKSFHTNEVEIYRIKHLEIKDTAPRSLYLTLVKDGINYVDKRETG